jgi:hypothetical protein
MFPLFLSKSSNLLAIPFDHLGIFWVVQRSTLLLVCIRWLFPRLNL